jgi:hypothetical protein
MPLVVSLIDKSSAFVVEKVMGFEVVGVTGDESCSAEEVNMLGHAIGLGKGASVGDDLILGFAL